MFGSYSCIVSYTCMASPRSFSKALSTVGCICTAEEGALPSYHVWLHFDPTRTRQEGHNSLPRGKPWGKTMWPQLMECWDVLKMEGNGPLVVSLFFAANVTFHELHVNSSSMRNRPQYQK